jgi:hypothetical protein
VPLPFNQFLRWFDSDESPVVWYDKISEVDSILRNISREKYIRKFVNTRVMWHFLGGVNSMHGFLFEKELEFSYRKVMARKAKAGV